MKFPLISECTGMTQNPEAAHPLPDTSDEPKNYPAPTVEGILPDHPDGGQKNLLPITLLVAPLRVDVARWSDDPAGREILQLLWNGVVVAEKAWPGAAPEEDLFIELPVRYFTEGEHELAYRVINWQGNSGDSEPVTLTIDITPPKFPLPPEKLEFPIEVELGGITRRYLQYHENQVVVTVPLYDFQPGDTLLCYWEESPLGDELFHEEEVTEQHEITFDGTRIEDLGNATYAITYVLRDRAGNLSKLSSSVPIRVDIEAPVLREHPWVVEAEPGNPSSLDPTNYSGGVRVRVPKDPKDPFDVAQLSVHWEGYDENGSHIGITPEAEDETHWDFRIPASVIPANFKREVTLFYSVDYDGEPEISDTYTLAVGTIKGTKVACLQSGGGQLRLSSVPADGADIRVPAWLYKAHTENMRINLWMSGIDSNNANIRFEILDGWPVDRNNDPVTAKLPKEEISRLKFNATFSLGASVSFDGGNSWVTFEFLDLNLVP
ncbi:hypothetical protein ACX3YG_18290 [Pseudomonas wadenswilerensis]